jgi:hypothetical protein
MVYIPPVSDTRSKAPTSSPEETLKKNYANMAFAGAVILFFSIIGGAAGIWYAGYVAGFGLGMLLLGVWRLRKYPDGYHWLFHWDS